MSKVSWVKRIFFISLLGALTPVFLPAQTFTTLHNFDYNDGANSYAGLVQATNGDLYGTTSGGGAYAGTDEADGTVFKITPGGTVTRLNSFDGANDANRWSGQLHAFATRFLM